MKILTLLGSPRKNGNTATVLNSFEELARNHFQVERIHVPDATIRGCLGCDACQKKLNEPGCVQKDDAAQIFTQMLAADIIVYASPVYAWDFTAQMKALLDRHYCLVKWNTGSESLSLLEGKRAMLLCTCGGVKENNADLIQVIFEREMNYVHGKVIGSYILGNCTTPKQLGETAQETARQMLADLNSTPSVPQGTKGNP